MMYLKCLCTDCTHNDGDGGCTEDSITISNDNMTSGGFLPTCEDYEESWESEELKG